MHVGFGRCFFVIFLIELRVARHVTVVDTNKLLGNNQGIINSTEALYIVTLFDPVALLHQIFFPINFH